jgi:zinc finger protein
MTEHEHLMTVATEECAEVAHRIAKAMRFGMDQVQEDADDAPEENPARLTNKQRIEHEYYQLRATLGLVGIDAWTTSPVSARVEREKVEKVRRYLERSRRCGTLDVPDVNAAAAGSGPPRLAVLASAMRKMLPPPVLAELVAHLDPLNEFVAFLRSGADPDRAPTSTAAEQRWLDRDWTCPACGTVNFAIRTRCRNFQCSAVRPTSPDVSDATVPPDKTEAV